MSDSPKPTMPDIPLATQDWVKSELKDTENRIEKAFHQQTQYMMQQFTAINAKFDAQNNRIDSLTRWMISLIFTMTLAIIITVLFK